MQKSVLVFGANGLTGRFLIGHLLQHSDVAHITAFSRTPLDYSSPKITNRIATSESIGQVLQGVRADAVFCSIGTTRKQAGSRREFERIDKDYVLDIAATLAGNGIRTFVYVSSIGANPGSSSFYLRTKGRVEEGLMELQFPNLIILRPSMLLGIRNDYRWAEEISKQLFTRTPWLFKGKLKRYAPVHASDVAAAMLQGALNLSGRHIIESDAIPEMASQMGNS
jgi:uncharacterized protein YbjT (DUF2867 family)